MDSLIDLIFENPFLLVLLIGGIISFLKGKSEKVEENEATANSSNRSKPAQAENPFERSRQREQTRSAEKVVTGPVNSKSIKEIREEQMLQFTGQVDFEENQQEKAEHKSSSSDRITNENTIMHRKKQAFKKDFNQSLTKKGLVNSVIMAEVLGPPRARNPYQTVIAKRRNRS